MYISKVPGVNAWTCFLQLSESRFDEQMCLEKSLQINSCVSIFEVQLFIISS